jgi:hypothetical protein
VSNRVTLFWEFNVYEPGSKASVWLLPGDGDPDKSLDEEEGAIRVVGPVPHEIADQVIDALEKGLVALGLTVIREATADD